MLVDRAALGLVLALVLSAGCAPRGTRGPVIFATLSNILAADNPEAATAAPNLAAEATALPRLVRTLQEINADQNIQFVVLVGNLVDGVRGQSVDRVRNALAELKKPYYVVLGPEALPAAGGAAPPRPPTADEAAPAKSDSASPPPAATFASASGAAVPNGSATAPGPEIPLTGPSLLAWAFRDHGFTGPQPYWQATVNKDLVLVALYTAAPGAGRPGHVDAAQLQWLDQTLAQCPDKAVILFSYHALVPFHPFDNTVAWEDRLVDNRREVLEIIDRHRNVLMAVSTSHCFAAGQVVGNVLQVGTPALSVWPLAYDVFKMTPDKVEREYIPCGTDEETREAFDRLAGDPAMESLFGPGEAGEQQIIQIFGGRKTALWNLNTVRP